MLAGWREPFFHKDGAISKPVQFSEVLRNCPEEGHQPLMEKQFGIIGVSIFATRIYVKYWFQCPSGTGASRNGLDLLHELFLYLDKDVAKAATTAFDCHLWYLSEHLIAFAFFDEKVSNEKKAGGCCTSTECWVRRSS